MEKGESGKTPTPVSTNKGVYSKSHRMMGDAMTPNKQGWNSFDCNDPAKKSSAIKEGGGAKRGGGDY